MIRVEKSLLLDVRCRLHVRLVFGEGAWDVQCDAGLAIPLSDGHAIHGVPFLEQCLLNAGGVFGLVLFVDGVDLAVSAVALLPERQDLLVTVFLIAAAVSIAGAARHVARASGLRGRPLRARRGCAVCTRGGRRSSSRKLAW